MPFDENTILIDGSVDYNAANDAAPTSTTKASATGAKVVDIKGTGAKGLAAVLILPEAGVGTDDTLTAVLEVSDIEAFTSDVHELGKFDKLATAKGIIVGSEGPCTVIIRFATDKRYVRINGTVGVSPDDFGPVKAFITPHPFLDL